MRDHSSIRRGFLEYFAGKGHEIVPSHSLLPPADPTLLFVNAGMVPFKDVFIGQKKVNYTRATSSQKCLRVSGKHNDLENVGRTPRHHTFFEMLGNFSFGDYFKRDAIRYGWEFLTEVAGLDRDRLWVTVHPDDDEAYGYWKNDVGFPTERLVRDVANVWSMGDTGPNGPCSEIHWDRGEAFGADERFVEGYDGDRFLEIWNLVFMQFDKSAEGVVTSLPHPSIDTGMGFERLASVLQGANSNYDTDLFQPLIAIAAKDAGRPYGRLEEDDVALRVIADHARATSFLIADGVYPENEGRGYVLRRIMRRAIRFGRKLGMEREFLSRVCDGVVDLMGVDYAELQEKRGIIARYVSAEEERFGKTLSEGLEILDSALSASVDKGAKALDGDVVFRLYDTHGFPMDLTRLIAEEKGVGVDEAGFERAMEAQRARGRASWKSRGDGSDWMRHYMDTPAAASANTFVGYERTQAEGTAVAIYADGEPKAAATVGGRFTLVCDQTPFYGESGGQSGDQGTLRFDGGHGRVLNVTKPHPDVWAHEIEILEGNLESGVVVDLRVDASIRERTQQNHTATHLLQRALGEVLGEHVKQRGSLVAQDRLRFDFSHFGAMKPEELQRVEAIVNGLIRRGLSVDISEKSMQEALDGGAIAFFEEKYGERVRVVDVGGESVELCGGTHVGQSGEIGAFAILSEAGISSGVRRIEAVTGAACIERLQAMRARLDALRQLFPGSVEEQLLEKIKGLQRDAKDADQQLAALRAKLAGSSIDDDLAAGKTYGDWLVVVKRTENMAMKELVDLTDRLREKIAHGAVLVVNANAAGNVNMVIATKDAPELHAGKLLGEVAGAAGGKGGGRPDLARGGAPGIATLDLAIDTFYRMIADLAKARG
jgi:alanyl-tRNA synthetase